VVAAGLGRRACRIPGCPLGPSALAIQAFLDTCATLGIRPAIARELLSLDSEVLFSQTLVDPRARVIRAERTGNLLRSSRVTLGATHALAPAGAQAERLRPTT
jgi:hypothetical protein